MRTSRESISVALAELLSHTQIDGEPAFATYTRVPKIWSNVTPAEQPWLCSFPNDEDDLEDQAYNAQNYLLNFTVLIYARADADPDIAGETLLNPLIDAVDDALQSQFMGGNLIKILGEPQTLGGLVTNCWIEGRMVKDLGILDQQMRVAIPLKIRVGM